MDFRFALESFQISDFISAMMKMISTLLGKDRKYAEQSWFDRIANWFDT